MTTIAPSIQISEIMANIKSVDFDHGSNDGCIR